MTIENNLERMATALESIAALLSQMTNAEENITYAAPLHKKMVKADKSLTAVLEPMLNKQELAEDPLKIGKAEPLPVDNPITYKQLHDTILILMARYGTDIGRAHLVEVLKGVSDPGGTIFTTAKALPESKYVQTFLMIQALNAAKAPETGK